MDTVTSGDGTTIAFDAVGSGPPLVLVRGALNDRKTPAELLPLLAPRYTVYTYDRRGRGDSGDTQPYAPAREVEDLRAILAAAGEPAFVYGHSSGAVLGILAAAEDAPITKLVAFEPPWVVDDTRTPAPADLSDRVRAAIAEGRRDDAVEMFLVEAVQLPAAAMPMVRNNPDWPGMVKIANTLPYDIDITAGPERTQAPPRDALSAIRIPTLVVGGGKSPEWARNAVAAAAEAIPGGRARTVDGEDHGISADAIAPVLIEFFGSRPSG
jgi:pimeloyl-ACP methyl ester carboxylesterase